MLGRDADRLRRCQLDTLNLTRPELLRVIVIAVVLLAGLGILRWVLKLTARILALGCLGIAVLVAVLMVMGMLT
jgi:hypothetical protein